MSRAFLWIERFRKEGFAIIHGVLDAAQVRDLSGATDCLVDCPIKQRGGVRNLLDASQAVRELANSSCILDIANSVLDVGAFPVRGILFDKTDGANWKVPWHQDLTIAVAEKVEMDGFGPWSVKAGVSHVQAPVSTLERIVSIRIHLDHCPSDNGALRVVPGSHRAGRLSENDAARIGASGVSVVCAVAAGDVVMMSPLIVHASSASAKPGHRRVIHLDFTDRNLPGGLQWATDSEELRVSCRNPWIRERLDSEVPSAVGDS